jgi:sugar-specific transcriptional regulator TrmB
MFIRGQKQPDLKTLISLGLNLCQAKVYLALVQTEISTAKIISKVSGVSRPDVYRIMDKLHKMGLVEKILDRPVMFKATPIQEGVSILLDHKIRNISEVSQDARRLIRKFGARNVKTTIGNVKHFVLIPGGKRITNWIKRAANTSQSSIDVVCSKEAFPKVFFIMDEVFKKAMNREVKIRCILEKMEKNKPFPKEVRTLKENSLFKLRFLPTSPGERSMIFDRKSVIVATETRKGSMESSGLWTDNPSILRIVNDYYELLWITSMETPIYNIDEWQA